MKYHIEKNTVQETLVIPLFGRMICSEYFPELFSDPETKRICDSLDYDFAEKRKKMESAAGLFGALELKEWSGRFASVTAKSYMRGYRDIYKNVGMLHKLMIRFCDKLVKMKIIKIVFR